MEYFKVNIFKNDAFCALFFKYKNMAQNYFLYKKQLLTYYNFFDNMIILSKNKDLFSVKHYVFLKI